MTQKELLTELRRSALLDDLRCLGCGYEHSCSVHGCAIILAAMEHIQQLAAENTALREAASLPNPPLTLEELREMDGEPVFLTGGWGWRICCGISYFRGCLCMETGAGSGIPMMDYGKTWFAYRRKPAPTE